MFSVFLFRICNPDIRGLTGHFPKAAPAAKLDRTLKDGDPKPLRIWMMIDISEIKPSIDNFYELSGLELLADDIEREGLKHNLVASKDKDGGGYGAICSTTSKH